MADPNLSTGLDEFSDRLINAKVNELIGHDRFPESARDDLRQTFRLNLLERRDRFDPDKGSWEAFVVVVCQNCCATVLSERFAEKRTPMREDESLNQTKADGSTPADHMDATQAKQHLQVESRSDQEQWELAEDTNSLLNKMPSKTRDVCKRMMEGFTKTRAASDLGLARSTIHQMLVSAREHWKAADMNDYLRL